MPPSLAPKGLLAACVLAALAFSSVESYKCTRCALNTCHFSTQMGCETSQSCFSYRQELFWTGQPLVFVEEKGCAERQCVPLNFSATLGTNMMFAYGHQCCSSELCNTGDFQVPQKSSVLNGVQCPACYAENNGHCEAVLLNCTGAETRCVHVEGTDGGRVDIFAKGCATETACNLKNLNVLNGTIIHTHCVNARGVSLPLLSVASSLLTALILLKVLL
ncbi:protein RoBo-1-like [Pteropus vampyrus]|uniref:Protein RoBo-1-like n=1 Tax=Pteropus vampyrus TaxID=132908 RepID=A0A6P3RNA6_PTEVA|nr:protein RoBo-1-like [Pteropus vampyrus]